MNIKKSVLAVLLSGIFIFSITGMSQAIPFIDTTGSWNGSDYISCFGEPNTSTYGQTFTVTDSETVLNSFTFFLDDFLNPDFVDFEAYVYAWDGNKATGPALYAGTPMSTTNNGGNDGFEAITINTGGVNLISGSQYVAFFTAANRFDGSRGTSKWGGLGGANVYSGGQFVYLNNGNDFGQLFTTNWNKNFQGFGSDLAFSMSFSDPAAPVPAPSTMLLLGLGLIGLVGYNYRRQKETV